MVLNRLDVQTVCKQNERERGKERTSHRQQRWVTELQTNQRLCLKTYWQARKYLWSS